jgi:S1-C subfamily serine protease
MPQMSGDDEAWDSEPPPAASRTWMHPSEVGRMQAALNTPEPRKLSISTVLVAGSFGAVAMFVLLAGVGVLQSTEGTVTQTPAAAAPLTTVKTFSSDVQSDDLGVLTVERQTSMGTVTTAGVVIDGEGHILTISSGQPTAASMKVHHGEDTYSGISVIGYDPTTELTLLTVHGLDGIEPPPMGEPSTDDETTLVTVGQPSATHGVTVRDTTAAVHGSDRTYVGMVAVESMNAPSTAAVLVSGTPARIVGVVSPADDAHGDNRYFATSARVMQRVGAQLLSGGTAVQASLQDPALGEDDRILYVDETPTLSAEDLAGCLMGYAPGDTVTVTFERDGEQHRLDTTLSTVEPPG